MIELLRHLRKSSLTALLSLSLALPLPAEAASLTGLSADASVHGDGEQIDAIVLDYDAPLDAASITPDDFLVEGRTVKSVSLKNGRRQAELTLTLDPLPLVDSSQELQPTHSREDQQKQEASGHHGPTLGSHGNPQPLPTLSAKVQQIGLLKTVSGELLLPTEERETEKVSDPVVESFRQDTFTDADRKTLRYNLYVPENYDPSKSYPLLLFMHDAGVVSPEVKATLVQGRGAISFAEPSWQEKHPCFVLAPQYDTVIVDDNYDYGPELDRTMHLIESLEQRYSIDRDRIYNTGQSMGGMTSIAMDVKYPDFFAGSYIVAAKWNTAVTAPLAQQNIWAVASVGDSGAFPSMNEMFSNFRAAGAVTVEAGIDTSPVDKLSSRAQALLRPDCHLYYTIYPGGSHRSTWLYAYDMQSAMEWVFDQKRPAANH